MMGDSSWGYSYPTPREERERLRKQEQMEREQRKKDLDDIDGDINWAYFQMRIIEAWLEQTIEDRGATLTEHDQKRIDKALVVTRTGLKMLKKVVKRRAPQLDTAAWKETDVATH